MFRFDVLLYFKLVTKGFNSSSFFKLLTVFSIPCPDFRIFYFFCSSLSKLLWSKGMLPTLQSGKRLVFSVFLSIEVFNLEFHLLSPPQHCSMLLLENVPQLPAPKNDQLACGTFCMHRYNISMVACGAVFIWHKTGGLTSEVLCDLCGIYRLKSNYCHQWWWYNLVCFL